MFNNVETNQLKSKAVYHLNYPYLEFPGHHLLWLDMLNVINSKNALIYHFTIQLQACNQQIWGQSECCCYVKHFSAEFSILGFLFQERKLMTFNVCTRNKSQSVGMFLCYTEVLKNNFFQLFFELFLMFRNLTNIFIREHFISFKPLAIMTVPNLDSLLFPSGFKWFSFPNKIWIINCRILESSRKCRRNFHFLPEIRYRFSYRFENISLIIRKLIYQVKFELCSRMGVDTSTLVSPDVS